MFFDLTSPPLNLPTLRPHTYLFPLAIPLHLLALFTDFLVVLQTPPPSLAADVLIFLPVSVFYLSLSHRNSFFHPPSSLFVLCPCPVLADQSCITASLVCGHLFVFSLVLSTVEKPSNCFTAPLKPRLMKLLSG